MSKHGCPDCINENPSYISKMMHLGTRRLLSANSPLRQRRFGDYHFVDEETRPPPALRTTALLKTCLQLVKDNNLEHVCGFAGPPTFLNRVGFDYDLDNCAEWMHALGRVAIFAITIPCGAHGPSSRAKTWASKGMDKKHRVECQKLGIFPSVWPGREIKLSDEQRDALLRPTDAEITTSTRPGLERCVTQYLYLLVKPRWGE